MLPRYKSVNGCWIIITFALWCSLCSADLYGQTWQELLAQVDSLKDKSLFDSSIQIAEIAIGKAKTELIDPDSALFEINYRIAQSDSYLGNYERSESILLKEIDKNIQRFGERGLLIGKAKMLLGWVYYRNSKFTESEQVQKEALMILESASGSYRAYYAGACNSIGLLYWHVGRLEEAEQYHLMALKIRKEQFGEENVDVAGSLNNLGLVYWSRGNNWEAEKYYRKAASIYEKVGPNDINRLWPYHNLAIVMAERGNFQEAEKLNRKVLEIRKETLGENHNLVALAYANLSQILCDLGKYSEAEELALKAKKIYERNNDLTYYPFLFQNLAYLYSRLGRYADVEELCNNAERLLKTDLGISSYYVGRILVMRAENQFVQGKYDEAYASLEKLADLKTAISADYYFNSRILRAYTLSHLSNYDQAVEEFDQALAEAQGLLFPSHPVLAYGYESFGQVQRSLGDARQSMLSAMKAYNIRKSNFDNSVAALSEKDALNYSVFLRRSANGMLSIYFDYQDQFKDKGEMIADVIFAVKGRASEAAFTRYREINMLDKLGEAADSLRKAKTEISRLYAESDESDTTGNRPDRLKDAISDRDKYERALLEENADYRDLRELLDISADDINKTLMYSADPAILLEYMQYNYLEASTERAVPHYLVVVMDGWNKPRIIDLGEAEPIDDLVSAYREHIESIVDQDHMPTQQNKIEFDKISRALYDRIVTPIEKDLADKKMVYVAPDAGLNLIQFGSLIDGDGSYLIEKFPIHYLSNGRDLVRLQDKDQSARGFLGIANPDYDATAHARMDSVNVGEYASADDNDYFRMRNIRSDCLTLKELRADPLPRTEFEVRSIASAWPSFSPEPVVTFFGPLASEDHVKSEASGKRVIHLATHGYFLQADCQPVIPYQRFGSNTGYVGENPLLLSGLLFAGANLHGQGADEAGLEDGILTAEEVTTLNLDGTDMVVLSACETGIGEVKNGEGVYGLRRAFQMAGARTVISALWPVSDKETAAMMSELYQKSAESIPEKMRRIQLAQLKNLRSLGLADHPFTWGAFVAMGDWR